MSTTSIGASPSVLEQYQVGQSSETKRSELGKTEFLELLVAQLNNQNPLEPQENGEFVAQLAQFSTVEGVQQLNSGLETILTGYQSSQTLQAASLVGRSVLVASGQVQVDTAAGLSGSVVLPSTSSNVQVNVLDAAGTQVGRIELGQQAAGQAAFTWDGLDDSGERLPSGVYRFEAQASTANGPAALSTLLPATISSITLGQGGADMTLNLAGTGSVSLSQVQVIGQ